MLRFLVLAAVLGLALSQGDNVERVFQKYDDKLNSHVVQQINAELQASYLYQAYSHYFGRADVALPGFAKWFEAASVEERKHATGLIDYINKRGGVVSMADINFNDMCTKIGEGLYNMNDDFGRTKSCICSFMSHKKDKATTGECSDRSNWKNGLWAMQDALVLERYVNAKLLDLHSKAENDPHLASVLEHVYLDEQVDSIKQIGDYVRQLERVGDGLGEYMFDKDL